MRSSCVRLPLLVFLGVAAAAPALSAQEIRTPYDAEVVTDEAAVWSGPGKKHYYTTGHLQRGARVRVHRHDYGGWYMIAPPEGSFSLIRADYVQRTGNRGTVTQNNIVVRVGSQLSQETSVEQIRLSSGDLVEILGEQAVTTGAGTHLYYMIRPPQNEFRWVEGKNVVPSDPVARLQHDSDPFQVPSNAERTVTVKAKSAAAPPKSADPFAQAPREAMGGWETQKPAAGADLPSEAAIAVQDRAVLRTAPPEDVISADRKRLQELDDHFREIVKNDPRQWNLDEIESGYRALYEGAAHPALRSQIELRFPAVERYRRIKREYDDLVQLTSETSRRDAELLSMQRQAMGGTMAGSAAAGSRILPKPDPASIPAQGPSLSPAAVSPRQAEPSASQAVPKFDGAGIIQRIAGAGALRHVLVAPDGRVLALLQPTPGMNLDAYVGQQMGLFGERSHRQDLRADLIVVRGLMPVRLSR